MYAKAQLEEASGFARRLGAFAVKVMPTGSCRRESTCKRRHPRASGEYPVNAWLKLFDCRFPFVSVCANASKRIGEVRAAGRQQSIILGRNAGGNTMKFGIFYEISVPRPWSR